MLRELTGFGHGFGTLEFLFRLHTFVTSGRNEIGVDGLVRQIEKVRLLTRNGVQPVQRIVCELIGDVAFLGHLLPSTLRPLGLGR